jgi:hypothetical protein
LLCGSINVRERPWASKRQPIDCKRCCTDRLNAHALCGLKSDVSRGPGSAKSRNYKLDLPPNADKFALANNVVKCD